MVNRVKTKRLTEWLLKVNPFDILIFLDRREGKMAAWKDLENYFVKGEEETRISTQTLSNYLKMLLSFGFVMKTIDEKTFQPVYVIKNPVEIPVIETVRRVEKALARALEQHREDWEQLSSDFLLEFELCYLVTKAYSAIYSHPSKSLQEIEEIINEIEGKAERLRDHNARIELVERIRKLRMELKGRLHQVEK